MFKQCIFPSPSKAVNISFLHFLNLSPTISMNAFTQNNMLFKYIYLKNQNEEMCTFAVKQDPFLLQHVDYKFMTRELCTIAVKKNPITYSFVNEEFQTEENSLIAVLYYKPFLECVKKDLYDKINDKINTYYLNLDKNFNYIAVKYVLYWHI